MSNPGTPLVSQVRGNIRARDTVYAARYCADGGTGCFDVAKIAGARADNPDYGIVCPPGEFVMEIVDGEPRCGSGTFEFRCPAGAFLEGFWASGAPRCSERDMFPCGSWTTQPAICPGVDNTLPHSVHGEGHRITGGYSRWERWQCDDGAWYRTDFGGMCTCTERTEERTRACDSGYSGTIEERRNFLCPADGNAGWTDWRPVDPDITYCVCEPAYDEWTQPCPPGHTGEIVMREDHICTDNVGEWGDAYVYSNSCACDDTATRETTLDCPDGYDGSITEVREFNCETRRWELIRTINDCSCTGATEQKWEPCPGNQVGDRLFERSYNCINDRWDDWEMVDESSCAPVPVAVCTWHVGGASQLGGVRTSGSRVGGSCRCGDTGPCYESNGYNQYTNYSACRCE